MVVVVVAGVVMVGVVVAGVVVAGVVVAGNVEDTTGEGVVLKNMEGSMNWSVSPSVYQTKWMVWRISFISSNSIWM